MLRVVELSRLLSGRGYLRDGSLSLSLDGRLLQLNVRDGRGTVNTMNTMNTPNEGEGAALSTDLATFGAIAMGSLRASDAARHLRAEGSAATLTLADSLFATRTPFRCFDEF